MKKVNHRFLLVLMYVCSVVLSSFLIFSCFIPTQEQKEAEKDEEINRTTVLSSTNEWVNGNFTKEGQVKKYTLHVTKGTRYFIYLNDSDDGDSTKTANVGMKISHADGTEICKNYGDAGNCYSSPFTFSASNNGVVTISVASYDYGWEKGTGTYAIKYNSRPENYILDKELWEGNWFEDLIVSKSQTNKYIIPITGKTRYFIYLEDINAGNAMTQKTADIGLKILFSDGSYVCDNYNDASDCFSNPYTFINTNYDTITIIAAAYDYGWEKGTGTYAIKYTTRPEYDELPAGKWVDDTIITKGQINKYTVNVSKGKTYKIKLDDTDAGISGDGKTADIGLKIFYDKDSNVDNPIICNSYSDATNCYNKPYTFTAPSDGTIVLAAAAYYYGWEKGTGSYAIRYDVVE